MQITIFDVEHGACALIASSTGAHALIDCGHNATTGWRPSAWLPAAGVRQLDELVITNYDEDHVSDLVNLQEKVRPVILTRNPTVTGAQLLQLKSQQHAPSDGMKLLSKMSQEYVSPVSIAPNWGPIQFQRFWNRYPQDFTDENNLSLVVFVHHPAVSVLFPGDLEKPGWRRLLTNPEFVSNLRRVHVLVASHHGRADGCCDEIFSLTGWRPQIVVISDDDKQYDTQETVPWYRARSSGTIFFGQERRVFSTRKDGHIFIRVSGSDARIDTSARQISAMRVVAQSFLPASSPGEAQRNPGQPIIRSRISLRSIRATEPGMQQATSPGRRERGAATPTYRTSR